MEEIEYECPRCHHIQQGNRGGLNKCPYCDSSMHRVW